MRERPIPFSGPMVRAILNGTKGQTRRAIKGQTPAWNTDVYRDFCLQTTRRPYGLPGDRLWVKEALRCAAPCGHGPWFYEADRAFLEQPTDDQQLRTVAKWLFDPARAKGYCNSRFMPRWASRLTLTITDVRVERLQDISAADAEAEGLVPWSKDGKLTKYGVADPDGLPGRDFVGTWPWHEWRISPIDAYEKLWDSINANRGHSWESNPWVWVISFERVA